VRRAALAVLTAAIAVAACGLPEDDRPRAISAEDAPIALGTSTTVSAPATGTRAIDVWLIDAEGRLRPVERAIESPATVQLALEALLAAPNEEEDALLDTAIPEGSGLVSSVGDVRYVETDTLLQAAEIIRGSECFVGNQSCLYALAEGMKHRALLEVWPGNPNCLFERDNVFHGWDRQTTMRALGTISGGLLSRQ